MIGTQRSNVLFMNALLAVDILVLAVHDEINLVLIIYVVIFFMKVSCILDNSMRKTKK